MISYEPLWATMKERGITKYQIIYHWGISSNTLRRMGHGEPITSNTLNELCLILDCRVEDILQFTTTEEEISAINERKEEIINFQRKKRKKQACVPSEHKAYPVFSANLLPPGQHAVNPLKKQQSRYRYPPNFIHLQVAGPYRATLLYSGSIYYRHLPYRS